MDEIEVWVVRGCVGQYVRWNGINIFMLKKMPMRQDHVWRAVDWTILERFLNVAVADSEQHRHEESDY